MNEGIIDKRRKENWDITFWCTSNSVIMQITLPENGKRSVGSPDVDIACHDFSSAVKLARAVCRRTPRAVGGAAALVFNWAKTTPETFLALLAK